MGVVEAGGLLFEVAEEIVAEVELDLARGADDDLPVEIEEDGARDGDEQKKLCLMGDAGGIEAAAHVIDGDADDERDEDLGAVVQERGEAAPGEAGPVPLEVGREGLQAA